MISQTHKFIFIHVPKGAGNSLAEKLLPYCEDKITRDKPFQDGVERFGLENSYGLPKHASIEQWHQALGAEKCRSYLRIAVARNPWDRMLSHYLHKRKTKQDQPEFVPAHFTRWLKGAVTFDHLTRLRKKSRLFWRKPGFAEGYAIDYFLRFEFLNEDWETLCVLLKIPYEPLVPRNKGEHRPYAEYYDRESHAVVAARCAREIEFFKHRF